MNHNKIPQVIPEGPPVDWNHCAKCGGEIAESDSRIKFGKGVAHEVCPEMWCEPK